MLEWVELLLVEEIWVTKQKIMERCIIQLSIQICCLNQKKRGSRWTLNTRCTGYEKDYFFSYSFMRFLISREIFLPRYSIVSRIPLIVLTKPLIGFTWSMAILANSITIGTSTVRVYIPSLMKIPNTVIPWVTL